MIQPASTGFLLGLAFESTDGDVWMSTQCYNREDLPHRIAHISHVSYCACPLLTINIGSLFVQISPALQS
jgi:hypothetical protein